MSTYFTHLSHCNQAKNKLEKAILELFQEHDGILIEENGHAEFMRRLDRKIDRLNKNNPRCKPVEIKWRKEDDYYSPYGLEALTFYLYRVKQQWSNDLPF